MHKSLKLFIEHSQWKGKDFISELYECDNPEGLSPINQVHAVCFLDKDTVVFYQHKDGWYGNPGGGIEPGESIEDTIRRELIEEAQLELVSSGLFGYEYIIDVANPGREAYFLRYVAKVRLIDAEINDPCQKATARIVVTYKEAATKLNWGEKGRILLELARNKFLTL